VTSVRLGRIVCWLRRHDWEFVLISFGRTWTRCRRCGAVRVR
jgi:hypothetical protein